ncbi:MAG: type II toxin-antitoxin system VapC family toxin [Candidatus Rokubacteria bacterium]|nr:type II toxin-antitoxin system VapC family toxin [Candidatus Rokubacteria bacterium]
MIGLDTNVLVRYLTQDDPAQTRRAINRMLGHGDRCAISIVVLCELVRVLRHAYGVERATIAATIKRVLDTAELVVDERDIAYNALSDYRRGPGDVADHVIGWRNRHAGCEGTATFDRALRGSDLFRVI